MIYFAIIEVADGLTIAEVHPGQSPEDAAAVHAGTVVDPGPYASYDEASDALLALEAEDDEDELV